MLSDETAIGNYPVESVRTLHNIISNVEKSIKHGPIGPLNSESDAIALAAVNASKISKADVIVVYSRSGNSILRVSRLRPERNIIGISPDPKLSKKFKLCYGVIPLSISKKMESIDEIIDVSTKLMEKKVKDLRFKKIVIVGGDPKQEAGKTNFVIVKTLEQ